MCTPCALVCFTLVCSLLFCTRVSIVLTAPLSFRKMFFTQFEIIGSVLYVADVFGIFYGTKRVNIFCSKKALLYCWRDFFILLVPSHHDLYNNTDIEMK